MYGPINPETKASGSSAPITVKVARIVGLPTSSVAPPLVNNRVTSCVRASWTPSYVFVVGSYPVSSCRTTVPNPVKRGVSIAVARARYSAVVGCRLNSFTYESLMKSAMSVPAMTTWKVYESPGFVAVEVSPLMALPFWFIGVPPPSVIAPARAVSVTAFAPAFRPSTAIDPPTIVMQFSVNDGPLAGREGDHVTSRKIRDRLEARLERLKDAVDTQERKVTELERAEAAKKQEMLLGTAGSVLSSLFGGRRRD